MSTKLRMVVKGMLTWFPGTRRFYSNTAGATESARYCYSVWLRHQVKALESNVNPYPKVVAELGPGNSLGVGLAALLSGCDQYIALDVAEFAGQYTNLEVFDDLVAMFNYRMDIPGDDEFPDLKPKLKSYEFPRQIFDDDRLDSALDASRLAMLRYWIRNINGEGSRISYIAPWSDDRVIKNNYVDLILSQAVLEHVDDLPGAYRAMDLWLKPSGCMSHQIDYKCHGLAAQWNGHWTYSEAVWKLMRGRKTYFLNREPHSRHIELLRQAGYDIVCEERIILESQLSRDDLARRYTSMSDEDLFTGGSFIQAIKPAF